MKNRKSSIRKSFLGIFLSALMFLGSVSFVFVLPLHVYADEGCSSGHIYGEWVNFNDELHLRTCEVCYEEVYTAHCWDGGETLTKATCTEPGSVKYVCADCGTAVIRWTEIDPENHLFDDWVDGIGNHTRSCERCYKEEYEDHTWVFSETVADATCTAPGSEAYICTVCAASETRLTPISPSNHAGYGTHTENAVEVGCELNGYTGDTVCDGCGAVLESGSEIPARGHLFGDWVDGIGNHTRSCERCNKEETEEHTWVRTETLADATCTAPGSAAFVCTVCGTGKTEETPADPENHGNYGMHTENAVEVSCELNGYTGDTVCDGCGAILASGSEIPAPGHLFDDWVDGIGNHTRSCERCYKAEYEDHTWVFSEAVADATCTAPGSAVYNCTVCTASEIRQTQIDPANHAGYGTHIENAVAAACESEGYSGDTVCDGCGAVLSTGSTIKALGHAFGNWTDHGENHTRSCSRCPAFETAGHIWSGREPITAATCKTAGRDKLTCSACGAEKTEDTALDPSNHAGCGTHIENAVAAACERNGYSGDTVCDGCGAVLSTGSTTKALGHAFGNWTDHGENHTRSCSRCPAFETAGHIWSGREPITAATCKTAGRDKLTCSVCGAEKTEDTALDLANHADYGIHIENAVAAACESEGYSGDTVCDGCGTVLVAGRVIGASGHAFGNWTDHGENHTRTCSRCPAFETAGHIWSGREPITAATCKTAGRDRLTCSVCGAEKTEETTLDPSNHAGYGTHIENAVAAACKRNGYSGDKVCNGCGAVLAAGRVIGASGHAFGNWTDNGETHLQRCTRCSTVTTAAHVWKETEFTPADCKSAGVRRSVCADCGAKQTQTLPKTDHTDANGDGVCDGCGIRLRAQEDACPYCGETHDGLFGWLVRLVHRLLFGVFGAK